MYELTYASPDVARAAADYRIAMLTRDYRRLRPVRAARPTPRARTPWWQRWRPTAATARTATPVPRVAPSGCR
jgi:hypothetical protein